MARKLSIKNVLYSISIFILVTDRYAGVNINYIPKMIIALLWSVYFFMSIISRDKKIRIEKVVLKHITLFLIPYVVIAYYTLLIWMISSEITISNITRLCSSILYPILYIGFACAGILLYGSKVIDRVFWMSFISYLTGSVLYMFVSCGISSGFEYMKILLSGQQSEVRIAYIMEVHGLTFMMGILFLYYLFYENNQIRFHKTKVILSALLIILGLKRIEIIALLIAIVVFITLLRNKKIYIKASIKIIIFSAIILLSGFIFIISTGILENIIHKYGIETSGRLEYYHYARNFFKYDVSYLGKGYTYFSKYIEQLWISGFRLNGYRIAASIHSDILCMYIELGFIMFHIWLIYSFCIKAYILKKSKNNGIMKCYLLLTIYMFVLYLTDNTFNYNNVQMAYFLIPLIVERYDKKIRG